MAKVKFKRFLTDKEARDSQVEDGQFIVTKQGTSYIDYGTDRVPTNGTVDQALNPNSLNAISNKAVSENIQQDITTGTISKCGYKIDGKDVYVRRVQIDALPNAREQEYEVPDLIWNDINVVNANGLYGGAFPINLALNSEYFIATFIRNLEGSPSTYVSINCGVNRSNLSGYINIYFTYK